MIQPSRDTSPHGVSHSPPHPVLQVVPALELAKQHDSAAAAPALPDFHQAAPVPSLSVVRRRLPLRVECHSPPTLLTVVTPRLRQAHARPYSPDLSGVPRRGLQLATSTTGRARLDKCVHQLQQLRRLRAPGDRACRLSCPREAVVGTTACRGHDSARSPFVSHDWRKLLQMPALPVPACCVPFVRSANCSPAHRRDLLFPFTSNGLTLPGLTPDPFESYLIHHLF